MGCGRNDCIKKNLSKWWSVDGVKLRYKILFIDFNFVYYIIFWFNLLNFLRVGYLLDLFLFGILLICECERIENIKL